MNVNFSTELLQPGHHPWDANSQAGRLSVHRLRTIFFAWWRWKRGVPRRVKRRYDGNVFYTDEIGRIRVFWA